LEYNKIYHGDSLEVLKGFEDNSVDTIICDPPYGYAFMNKDWDKAVVSVEVWKECLRVLKHGAFAAIMSSPRQDVLSRMIVNLQDAGFRTDFTSIYWTYACLSEDTEVLTEDGWELFNMSNRFIAKKILCYDISNDRYHFESPKEWKVYNQIKDTLYRIKSDNTDQLVTRNHRCLVEREGKLLFQFAEELGQEIKIPYLDSLPSLSMSLSNVWSNDTKKRQNDNGSILFDKLSSESGNSQISFGKWKTQTQNVRRTETKTERINDGRKELGLERGSNLFQKEGQLYQCQIYSMSKGISNDGSKGWLCYGTSNISSESIRSTTFENRGSSSYRSQSSQQFIRQPDAFYEQPTSQEIRTLSRTYKTTLASVTREYYEGSVFCPVVSTGCFIARRNGKIFLTGNSGFPKAANVSKLVDKKPYKVEIKAIKHYLLEWVNKSGKTRSQINKECGFNAIGYLVTNSLDTWGVNLPPPNKWLKMKQVIGFDDTWDYFIKEGNREIVGQKTKARSEGANFAMPTMGAPTKYININETKSATEQAKALDGSYAGFQPKPAVEVILMVMKSLNQKSFVDQALSNGKGITWLDSCRIPFSNGDLEELEAKNPHTVKAPNNVYGDYSMCDKPWQIPNGRFPANLLCSDDVLNDGSNRKSGKPHALYSSKEKYEGWGKTMSNRNGEMACYGDSGSYSRYFSLDKWFDTTFPFLAIPKASTSEKNKGLDKWMGMVNDGRKKSIDNPFQRGETVRKNTHATVKPLKLMSWLVTLLSRPQDIILDPFMGSGTTCIAAKLLKRNYIGIERELEYLEIAQQRINAY
jgi:DNA modification methylase